MIQNAVFVLGAGASCPYGFPTGEQLRRHIISKYANQWDNYLRAKDKKNPLIPEEVQKATRFAKKFSSSIDSIDLFLARNTQYSLEGKRAIVFNILAAEEASNFREQARYRDQDWYTWLLKQMTDELVQKDDYSRFSENDVSFITFNYDRSFEYFLYDTLVNSFVSIPEEKIIEQLNQIKICHVFGQVGPLEWQERDGQIKYRVNVNTTNIDDLCNNIKIVYEKEKNPKLEEAQELISRADRVFFLGFGYARENLDALGFPDTFEDVSFIYGTGVGLTDREIERVASLFRADIRIKSRSVNIRRDKDCLVLLREVLG